MTQSLDNYLFNEILKKEISSDGLTVRYSLYSSETIEGKPSTYSISTTTLYKGEAEHCIAYDITVDKLFAFEIFDYITKGFVTSCTLKDILEDIL